MTSTRIKKINNQISWNAQIRSVIVKHRKNVCADTFFSKPTGVNMIGYMIIVQQTAALERQPDRRAILRQNGTGGGRVFAGWIWRGLALCGKPQTMTHLLSCRLLDEVSTADGLATVTERAKACARKWENIV